MYQTIAKLIPPKFFDAHIHAPFLQARGGDLSEWKRGTMSTGYFFESGLRLKTLDRIYPFNAQMHGISLPIPYGPFAPLDVNEAIVAGEVNTPRLWVALRGDVAKDDLSTLQEQLSAAPNIVGLKLYQPYSQTHTADFLRHALYPELLKLADNFGLIFFIHTNNLDDEALDVLADCLDQYQKTRVLLTHAGTPLLEGYASFSFSNRVECANHSITAEHLKRESTRIELYQHRARRMLAMPRLYVNTALLANELTLYAIVSIFAGSDRFIYGSDLPFSLISRIQSEREPVEESVGHIRTIFEDGNIAGNDLQRHHEHIVFLLERIYHVLQYIDATKTADVFADMLWHNPVKLLKKIKRW